MKFVNNLFSVYDTVNDSDTPLKPKEISSITGLSIRSVHRYLNALSSRNMIKVMNDVKYCKVTKTDLNLQRGIPTNTRLLTRAITVNIVRKASTEVHSRTESG